MELEVHDAPDRSRYEAHADGDLAGFAEYRMADQRVIFTHTEVEPAYEGQGVASGLIRGALDDARQRRLAVTARCAFVRAWIDRHPDYAELERAAQQ